MSVIEKDIKDKNFLRPRYWDESKDIIRNKAKA